jgi:hypothetical protein
MARDPTEMMVRSRVAQLAGGRVLTEDEEVAVRVAGGILFKAIVERDAEEFEHGLVMLVEAWPKSLLLGIDEREE